MGFGGVKMAKITFFDLFLGPKMDPLHRPPRFLEKAKIYFLGSKVRTVPPQGEGGSDPPNPERRDFEKVEKRPFFRPTTF